MFVSGCAGYRQASLPGAKAYDEIGESATIAEVGSKVNLVQTTGVVLSGKVLRISDEYIVLEVLKSTGLAEYQISNNQISSLEVRTVSRSIPLLLVATVLVVVVVAVVVAATRENVAEVTFKSLD